jgi:hypothetical protein
VRGRILNKKYILAPLVIVVLATSIFIYRLHTMTITSVIIADDKLIASDGLGAYQPSAQGVYIGIEDLPGDILNMDLNQSFRLVHVKFADAHWKDVNLLDMPSRLPSKSYRMVLWLSARNKADIFKMGVGERLMPPDLFVILFFYEPNTGALACVDTIYPFKGDFMYNSIYIRIAAPEPPLLLSDDGHLQLTRTSEYTWVLDMDGWLASFHRSYRGDFLKCYVRLTLMLTISMKSAI